MAVDPCSSGTLSVVSFNLHGFYQGAPTIDLLTDEHAIDVFMLQEHWLTPTNLCLFEKHFDSYFAFGSSALVSCLESGMLRGRPFGGVMTLINKKLRKNTVTVHCEERFVIIKVFNCLLINVYCPCSGTADRSLIYESLLSDIMTWRNRFSDCDCVIAGDFNSDLDGSDAISLMVRDFIHNGSFIRCDDIFPEQKVPTYVNEALRVQSRIDYMLTSDMDVVNNFVVMEPNINFSDHLPIMLSLNIGNGLSNSINNACNTGANNSASNVIRQWQMRWDKADIDAYYHYTGTHLTPFVNVVDNMLQACALCVPSELPSCIEHTYDSIVSILNAASSAFVPRVKKGFYKFWWNEELSTLKQASVESDKLWKSVGRPRSGPIFANRQSCRLKYRKCLRDNKQSETEHYTNDLHEALLQKNNTSFWRCWRSRFECNNSCIQVDGCVDPSYVAEKFASHFSTAYSCNDVKQADRLLDEFQLLRNDYCGMPLRDVDVIDTELVSHVLGDLKRGKAAGIDGLTAEHLLFAHPALCVLLAKLFQLMMAYGYVPNGFRYSYVVPLPKPKECFSKSLKCDDFRGIAISPIISKLFEYCVLDRFKDYLVTTDNQFGFKKNVGCNFAIRTVRNIVDSYIRSGCTANLCTIDLSKAFDKVNHNALFIKLMNRRIPVELLNILHCWLSACYVCVKWFDAWSNVFKVGFGVRQGSVLSPFLFAVYLDDLAKLCDSKSSVFIILYADDILLVAPTLSQLDSLFKSCERELNLLDMAINYKKSACIRIGHRMDARCVTLSSSAGTIIPWVKEIRYLGVYILQSRTFKCSLSSNRKAFYRSANAIFGKIGRIASEEVVLQLVKSKCISSLLYGLDACALTKSELSTLDFTVNRFFLKLFKTGNIEVVKNCQAYFDFSLPSVIWAERAKKLEAKFVACDRTFVHYGLCVEF